MGANVCVPRLARVQLLVLVLVPKILPVSPSTPWERVKRPMAAHHSIPHGIAMAHAHTATNTKRGDTKSER